MKKESRKSKLNTSDAGADLVSDKNGNKLQKSIGVACYTSIDQYSMLLLHRGITLISLIITIILLLILAGVVLNLTLGNNGIFKLASDASKNYIDSTRKEGNEIAKVEEYIQNSRDTITVPKEEYETLRNTVEMLKQKVENISVPYIDTSRKLTTLQNDVMYTATEDSVVVGYVNTKNAASASIYIDGVQMGVFYNNNQNNDSGNVYYPLKKGQTVRFHTADTTKFHQIYICVYGILK